VGQSAVDENVSTEAEVIIEIRHPATTCEDTADCEDLLRAVMTCKSSTDPIINPNPVYNHSYT
jgi:hypothetical protein